MNRVAYPIKFILKGHVIMGWQKSNTTPGGTQTTPYYIDWENVNQHSEKQREDSYAF